MKKNNKQYTISRLNADTHSWDIVAYAATIGEAQDMADLMERATGVKHNAL